MSAQKSERLQKLKLLIGQVAQSHPRDYITAPNVPNGIARGIVVELLGPCRTEWLIQVLKLHPEHRTFWAETEQRILPTSLHQRGLDLSKITFGVLDKNQATTLRRIIQSQLYQFVIAPNTFDEIKIFQAFQLFTEKSNAILFLMGGKNPTNAWPISTQLEISKGRGVFLTNEFNVEVIKQKHSTQDSGFGEI